MNKILNISRLMVIFTSIFTGFIWADDLYKTFPSHFNLTSLNGTNGLTMNGIHPGDSSGISVSELGDINGDGIDDFIIGTRILEINTGTPEVYIIFGHKKPWAAKFNFAELNGNNGFIINGFPHNAMETSVSGAGDVNGDGLEDLLIGVTLFSAPSQRCVVFGSKRPWPAKFNLTNLDGSNGFMIYNSAHARDDDSGSSVSKAGDINGDGIDDFLIGNEESSNVASENYVVFGSKKSWSSKFDLASLNGHNGFRIHAVPYAFSGTFVSEAGDINGDGISDILLGALFSQNYGRGYALFGNKGPWPAKFNLTNLDGNNGFAIKNTYSNHTGDTFISGIGDFNDDGLDDFIIGSSLQNDFTSQRYVVFGSNEPWPAELNLTNLNGNNGFTIICTCSVSSYKSPVNGAGDINGDGIPDVLIGVPSGYDIGQVFAIFGAKGPWPPSINLADLNGNNGFVLNGINRPDGCGRSVSGAGDVNGDGVDDFLIGAPFARNGTGQTYMIFGIK